MAKVLAKQYRRIGARPAEATGTQTTYPRCASCLGQWFVSRPIASGRNSSRCRGGGLRPAEMAKVLAKQYRRIGARSAEATGTQTAQ